MESGRTATAVLQSGLLAFPSRGKYTGDESFPSVAVLQCSSSFFAFLDELFHLKKLPTVLRVTPVEAGACRARRRRQPLSPPCYRRDAHLLQSSREGCITTQPHKQHCAITLITRSNANAHPAHPHQLNSKCLLFVLLARCVPLSADGWVLFCSEVGQC